MAVPGAPCSPGADSGHCGIAHAAARSVFPVQMEKTQIKNIPPGVFTKGPRCGQSPDAGTERDRHPRGLRAAPRPAPPSPAAVLAPARAGVHVPGHPETLDSLCTRRHTEGCPPASLTHAGSHALATRLLVSDRSFPARGSWRWGCHVVLVLRPVPRGTSSRGFPPMPGPTSGG